MVGVICPQWECGAMDIDSPIRKITAHKVHGEGASADLLASLQNMDPGKASHRAVSISIQVFHAISKGTSGITDLGVKAIRGIVSLLCPREHRCFACRVRKIEMVLRDDCIRY